MGTDSPGEQFGRDLQKGIAKAAKEIFFVDEIRPDRAWTFTNPEGQVFLAQGKDRGEAYRIIEDASHEYPTADELKRCKAMDGLGYSELYGLYSGLVNSVPCANLSCKNSIHILGAEEGAVSGPLVDQYERLLPIVIGNVLFCSRECYGRLRTS